MIGHRLTSVIEAVLGDRRPKGFRASPEDAEVLRVAIELRAACPGAKGPDEQFIAALHGQLAGQADELSVVELSSPGRHVAQATALRAPKRHLPIRGLVGIAAAAVALVGGTVMVTNTVDHPSRTTTPQVALGSSLRFGSLHAANGRLVGQVYVHAGDPSWIFMSMSDGKTTGTVMCQLQLANGSTVPVGAVQVHDGRGQLARTVAVDPSQLRGAKLVTPGGSTVASTTSPESRHSIDCMSQRCSA